MKFADRLAEGSATLNHTTKWISDATKNAIADGTVTRGALQEGSPRALAAVHFNAMRFLITQPDKQRTPETLLPLERHVLDAQGKLERLGQACSLLMVVPAYVVGSMIPGTDKIQASDLIKRFVEFIVHDIKHSNDIFENSVQDMFEQLQSLRILTDESEKSLHVHVGNLKKGDQKLRQVM